MAQMKKTTRRFEAVSVSRAGRGQRGAGLLRAGFCAAVATALFCGCKPPTALQPPPPTVEVAEVLVTDVPLFGEYVGQTEARANVDVRARVEGFIQSIDFREGSVVHQGDILFRIEKEPIEQQLYHARATLAEAQAALSKAQADITRYTPLVEKRAIPRQDLENAQAAEMQARAMVEASQADVRQAEIDLSYTDVTAPVTGMIGAKQADVGSLVGGFNASLLATISPLNPIWFNANISEVDYLEATRWITLKEVERWSKAEHGERAVRLVLADGTEHPETGYFIFLDRAVDPKTGTLRLRAQFPNPNERLRPGMFGRIRVLLNNQTNVVLVPQRAVQEIQGSFNVFKLDSGDKAVFTPVKPGKRVGPLWIVEEGLESGDRIITEGLLKVRDGAPVVPAITNISDTPVQELRKLVPTQS